MSRENDLIVLQEQMPALGVSNLPDTVTLQGGADLLVLHSADPAPIVLQSTGEAITLIETASATTPGTSVLLVVQELDGTPSVGISKLLLPNGTVTDNGDGSATYTPSGGGTIGGTVAAGQIAYGTATDTLGSDAGLSWDATNHTLSVTTSGSHAALVGNTATGLAVKGRATGTGGWGVYGYGGGAGGSGVVAEVDQPDGIPLIGQAASGQTADLLQLLVDVALPFAVGASGRPRWSSTPPSSASDTGMAGEIAWDSSFLYVCVATNSWARVGLATW